VHPGRREGERRAKDEYGKDIVWVWERNEELVFKNYKLKIQGCVNDVTYSKSCVMISNIISGIFDEEFNS
jgi:hypothetical protein